MCAQIHLHAFWLFITTEIGCAPNCHTHYINAIYSKPHPSDLYIALALLPRSAGSNLLLTTQLVCMASRLSETSNTRVFPVKTGVEKINTLEKKKHSNMCITRSGMKNRFCYHLWILILWITEWITELGIHLQSREGVSECVSSGIKKRKRRQKGVRESNKKRKRWRQRKNESQG